MADQGTRLETEDDVRPRAANASAGGPRPIAGRRRADRHRADRHRIAGRGRLPAALPADPSAADAHLDGLRRRLGGVASRFASARIVLRSVARKATWFIPHDAQISGRHAELRQALVKEKYRWSLVDLQSTNGTYVRVGQAILEHGQEFLIGCTRFRFEKPTGGRFRWRRNRQAPPSKARASGKRLRSGGHMRGHRRTDRRRPGDPLLVGRPRELGGQGRRALSNRPVEGPARQPAACQDSPPRRWPMGGGKQQVRQWRVVESGADFVQGNLPFHAWRAEIHHSNAAIKEGCQP